MKTLRENNQTRSKIVNQAAEALAAGGLILFPTETTYGAGVDATNPTAVAKLLAYKSRREGKPLSIAVTDQAMAEKYVVINESAANMYRRFLPGPVTVVSQGKGVLASGVESEFGTLGVRIPDYSLVTDIVAQLGRPITATSANASNKKRPYSIEDVLANISDKQKSLIDLIIDAGTLPPNPPSTVIDTTLSTPVTMRQGQIQNEHTNEQLVLRSHSEFDTKGIAGKLMLKHWNQLKKTGLVIGLDGALGVGKTIFTKGIADFLQIDETLTSPTYTYIEEYDFVRHGVTGKLFHLDMWKVDSKEQFARLDFSSLLKPHSLVVVEWWQQVAAFAQPVLGNAPLLEISISETDDVTERQIRIEEHP